MPRRWTKAQIARGIREGYRSGLEDLIAEQIYLRTGQSPEYESVKIKFVQPAMLKTYTPDFILPNGIIIETKGRFTPQDRKKHLLIQQQHPNLDIRFVFSNPNQKLSKRSNTSYAAWCQKYGFQFAAKRIPEEWFREPPRTLPIRDGVIYLEGN